MILIGSSLGRCLNHSLPELWSEATQVSQALPFLSKSLLSCFISLHLSVTCIPDNDFQHAIIPEAVFELQKEQDR
jgi:hypothetical protein